MILIPIHDHLAPRDRLTVEKASLVGGVIAALVFAFIFIIYFSLNKKKTTTASATANSHPER